VSWSQSAGNRQAIELLYVFVIPMMDRSITLYDAEDRGMKETSRVSAT
jgi:hypothetical protein